MCQGFFFFFCVCVCDDDEAVAYISSCYTEFVDKALTFLNYWAIHIFQNGRNVLERNPPGFSTSDIIFNLVIARQLACYLFQSLINMFYSENIGKG